MAAELSLGRLPETILEKLSAQNISLLPEEWDDISASCSCPDWANPCKHLAAVYYIIANEIDKDPFILFKLRALETGELLRAAGFISTATPVKTSLFRHQGSSPLSFLPYDSVKIDKKHPQQKDKPTFPVDISKLAANTENDAFFTTWRVSLFYTNGNFKTVLLKAYQNITRALKKQELRKTNIHSKIWSLHFFILQIKTPHIFFLLQPARCCRLPGN